MEWLLVPGFTENGMKYRKYPVSGSCVDDNALLDVRGQRRLDRLVRNNRKATVTQITTRYNQDMQNTISEHVEPWSRWAPAAEDHTGCCSCQIRTGNGGHNSHSSPKLDNRRLEKRCLVWWVSISAATFRCRVRIWCEEHESMDPSCLVSTVQAAGGVMVCGIFSWHTLGSLVPIEHHLNATAYLSIVADHDHPFMTTVYPSSDVLPAG